MDFYDKRKQACEKIKSMASEGIEFDDIVFFIYEEYALSKKIVQAYYDELQARGFVKKVKKKVKK